MTTIAPAPTHELHDELDALLGRLVRINAQRAAMRVAVDSGSPDLDPMLDTLERDLTLAARAAASLHDRVSVSAWEPSS